MTVHVQVETPATADAIFEPVCELFAAVFGAPPLSRAADVMAHQRRSFRSLMARPTFGMVTATDSGTLAGFAYGYGLPGDTRWWEGMQVPVPSETTGEWDGRTFAVIDLAVAHAYQRQGIGARMLDTLLASRPEERATLAVVPDNTPAHSFYRGTGWEHVGLVKGAPQHTSPYFELYVRPIR